MVSPTMISAPLRPWSCAPSWRSWTSQFSVWQCRQSSSFSRTKKPKMPPRIDIAAVWALPTSKACGMTSRNAAPSSAPMAKDTSIGNQLARKASAHAASPTDSVPPATLAAGIQPSVMGLAILREPDQGRHAAGGAFAAVGEEALRLRIRAKPAAMNVLDAARFEPLSGNGVQIEQPMPGAGGNESALLLGEKDSANLVAHLVNARPDRRPEPGDQCLGPHCAHRSLDHARRQAAPSGVGDPDGATVCSGQDHGHAIGNHDRAHRSAAAGYGSVCLRLIAGAVR